jgi:glycosyltransferase involved in cell wall biosynthesis
MWLVHDYLTQRGGAERVVLAITRAFPGTPLLTSLYVPESTFPEFQGVDVRTLPINRIGAFRRNARTALPLLAPVFAARRVDDDVLCSSSGWAHLVRTTGRKVVYCHSPAKWLYRSSDYLGATPGLSKRVALMALGRPLRRSDGWGARSVDEYVANSTFIARQIEQTYGRTARVVFPPIGIDATAPSAPVDGVEPGYILTVARLLPYKSVTETVAAFRSLPSHRLIVVGDGPLLPQVRSTLPPNVQLLTAVEDSQLRWLYANAAGLVAASREDFGLTPPEAGAFGKPVAALRWGGYLDTVVEDETGVFFDSQTPQAIAAAVERLAREDWDAGVIRRNAERFSEQRFIAAMRDLMDSE